MYSFCFISCDILGILDRSYYEYQSMAHDETPLALAGNVETTYINAEHLFKDF